MPVRTPGSRAMVMAGAAAVLSTAAFLVPFGGTASAAPSVTLSPSASSYSAGTSVDVSGTGFPSITADPSGLEVLECSAPSGVLPNTAASCDGNTVNPLPINQDSSGAFSYSDTVQALSSTGGSNIDCGATAATECVFWVGVDYNNSFNSNDAFSPVFEVSTPIATTPEAPLAIGLPIGAGLLAAGSVFVARRRRRTGVA